MFLLPGIVGLVASALFDVAEVVETLPALLAFTVLFLTPVTLAQFLGLAMKSWRELSFHSRRGTLTVFRFFDVLYTHLRVITARGWSLLFMSLVFVLAALGWQWASLGTIAAIGLFLFYVTVGWTVFTSTFLVRTFESGIGRARAGIERSIQPAVCVTGSQCEEVMLFRRTPVPWGYNLLVEEALPARLQTETRYRVGATAKNDELERRGRIRATPRGVYLLGPAKLWYQDILGITRISVASLATAELKVLPKIRPVQIIEAPATTRQTPDVLTRPHRFPTEDYFRFREYLAGDDTRRIHWRLSMRSGRLTVKRPETREITKREILVVIDSFLPKGRALNAAHGADEILDSVVDAALGLVRHLVDQGDKVILASAALTTDLRTIEAETLNARPGTAMRWQDLGARVQWQGDFEITDLMEEVDPQAHAIVVSARFTSSPPPVHEDLDTTWVILDPAEALGPPDKHWMLQLLDRPGGPLLALFTRPHPVGSDDNSLVRRFRNVWTTFRHWNARRTLRAMAQRRVGRTTAEIAARGDAVYRLERLPNLVRLRNVAAGRGRIG